jgi:hypothetical protein
MVTICVYNAFFQKPSDFLFEIVELYIIEKELKERRGGGRLFTADTGNCCKPKTEHIVSFLDHS